ncbi:MAG TPA: nickel-dependent lactate racemase, partial [Planctomycetota bacterium]|nr:nickel-dependent lactate racemase [Planctomycetota bacterium]
AYRAALHAPIGSPPLRELARRKKPGTVCITISDATRPVPSREFLPFLIEELEAGGVSSSQITILIGTGMHRRSTPEERDKLIGPAVLKKVRVVDHDATQAQDLTPLREKTRHGTQPSVNRHYATAELKIVTGFIEPHFMAGFSGGRKGVCPALVNLETLQKFHGVGFLENPNARSGNLAGNPLHEEALDVARIVGIDFLFNVTLTGDRKLAGVFAGNSIRAHEAGCRQCEAAAQCEVETPFDFVVTTAGGLPLDATLYQAGKGLCAPLPVMKEQGARMLAAISLKDGIGSKHFTDIMLEYDGKVEQFIPDIQKQTKLRTDQWGLEMQVRVLRKTGIAGLVVACDGIPEDLLAKMSLTPATKLVGKLPIEKLIQATFDKMLADQPNARIGILPEGPYLLPVLKSAAAK